MSRSCLTADHQSFDKLTSPAALLYNNNQKLERNHEEAEARMDELEGTLRGHIGLIEEALERIETKQGGAKNQQQMGSKAEELYSARGKDGSK